MKKYEIEEGKEFDEFEFLSSNLQAVNKSMSETYPQFKEWIYDPKNRFFFREAVNTAFLMKE